MSQEFKPGLTWRIVLVLLVAALVFVPVATYLQLVSGAGIAASATYITIILFSEFFGLMGYRFTKQELTLLFLAIPSAASVGWLGMVYRIYFMQSPITWSFRINGIPLPRLVPSWWVPPLGSRAYYIRNLICTPEWIVPLLTSEFMVTIFPLIASISLTLMLSYMYIEIEKLPFPIAPVAASLVTTLTERKPEEFRIFTLSLYPGMVWAAFLYLSQMFLGFQIVPLPWIDFTPWTYRFLPGALIGFATDIVTVLYGFMIPFTTAAYMLIGSMACWVIGNSLTLTVFKDYFPTWYEEYFPGMSLAASWQRSILRVWIVPQIGLGFALALYTIMRGWRNITRAFSSLLRHRTTKTALGAEYPSLAILLLLFIGSTLASAILYHILVPGFPLWVCLILVPTLSFATALISTRAIGETGSSISIPYLWNVVIYMSGYKGVDAWLLMPSVDLSGVAGNVQNLKVGYLTGTKPMDIIKAMLIAWAIGDTLTFIYTNVFWSMAPIPSSAYPFALMQWPITIVSQCVWITGQVVAQTSLLLGSIGTGIAILFLGDVLTKIVGLPFSAAGLVTGFFTIPPSVLPLFLGSSLNRYVMPKLFGAERWNRVRGIIVAGFACGEGVMVGLGIAFSLIGKAAWLWPW